MNNRTMRWIRGLGMILAVGMAGDLIVSHALWAAEPFKQQQLPILSPVRIQVSKETKRGRVKEQVVYGELDPRTGQPMKGAKTVTRNLRNEEMGVAYRIELANNGTKAYPNLKVVWTIVYTHEPPSFGQPGFNPRDTRKEVTKTGSQSVNLNLGRRAEVTTDVVEPEVKGYKIELYDGKTLLAVESQGLDAK